MGEQLQTLVVILIALGALAYLGRRFFRTLRPRGGQDGCGSGGGCGCEAPGTGDRSARD
jgi:hypothetical protein